MSLVLVDRIAEAESVISAMDQLETLTTVRHYHPTLRAVIAAEQGDTEVALEACARGNGGGALHVVAVPRHRRVRWVPRASRFVSVSPRSPSLRSVRSTVSGNGPTAGVRLASVAREGAGATGRRGDGRGNSQRGRRVHTYRDALTESVRRLG